LILFFFFDKKTDMWLSPLVLLVVVVAGFNLET